jgi:hypothetical protein
LDIKNAKQFGLQNSFKMKLQLISNLIISKHVSLAKVDLVSLKIPIIQKIKNVKFIDSKPSLLRTKLITKSRILGFHPIDIFVSRPITFEKITFMQYFRQYTHDHKMYYIYPHFSKDNLGFNIYENKKLIQFMDFHPIYNNEDYFSTFYYKIYHFEMRENYYRKSILNPHMYMIKGLFHNADSLNMYLMQYENKILLKYGKCTQLTQKNLNVYPN